MHIESEIKKWGNSLALRITGAAAEIPNLKAGSKVDIEIKKDSLIIRAKKPVKRKIKLPYSESDLLKGLDEYTAHADILAKPSSKEMGD